MRTIRTIILKSYDRTQPADRSGWSDTLRAHAPSVRRGYVPAEQGITPTKFLFFTITAECKIAAGAIGDKEPMNGCPILRPQSAVEERYHVHSSELEAVKATKEQGFRSFQIRILGY